MNAAGSLDETLEVGFLRRISRIPEDREDRDRVLGFIGCQRSPSEPDSLRYRISDECRMVGKKTC